MKFVRVLKGYCDYHSFKEGSICEVVGIEKFEEGLAYDLRIYNIDEGSTVHGYRQSIFQKDVEVLEDQPKIINFMRLKAACTDERYFTMEDEKLIWNWSNKEAGMVWRKLISYFEENLEEDGKDWLEGDYFTSNLCPFCLFQRTYKHAYRCETCQYGVDHKICSHENSDYQMIIKPAYKADYKNIDRKIKKFIYNQLENDK